MPETANEITELFKIRLYLEYLLNTTKLHTLEAGLQRFMEEPDSDVLATLEGGMGYPVYAARGFMNRFNSNFIDFCEVLLKLNPSMTIRKTLDAVKGLDD